jgi:hypothetical protein
MPSNIDPPFHGFTRKHLISCPLLAHIDLPDANPETALIIERIAHLSTRGLDRDERTEILTSFAIGCNTALVDDLPEGAVLDDDFHLAKLARALLMSPRLRNTSSTRFTCAAELAANGRPLRRASVCRLLTMADGAPATRKLFGLRQQQQARRVTTAKLSGG